MEVCVYIFSLSLPLRVETVGIITNARPAMNSNCGVNAACAEWLGLFDSGLFLQFPSVDHKVRQGTGVRRK
jgi:hypothetical protein